MSSQAAPTTGQFQSQMQRGAVGPDQEVVVADVGVHQGVAGGDLGEGAGQRGGVLEVGQVRLGRPQMRSQ